MVSIDFKKAFVEDVREIALMLRVLNSLRDTNLARLSIINRAANEE